MYFFIICKSKASVLTKNNSHLFSADLPTVQNQELATLIFHLGLLVNTSKTLMATMSSLTQSPFQFLGNVKPCILLKVIVRIRVRCFGMIKGSNVDGERNCVPVYLGKQHPNLQAKFSLGSGWANWYLSLTDDRYWIASYCSFLSSFRIVPINSNTHYG